MLFIKNRWRVAPSAAVFILFIIVSLGAPLLFAGGSREFSKDYQNDLLTLFEEAVIRIESGEIDAREAKTALALLRTRYKVEYNDFAGKIDAIIDEVDENKKSSQEALTDFTLLNKDLARVREQEQHKIRNKVLDSDQGSSQGGNNSGGGGSNSRKNN